MSRPVIRPELPADLPGIRRVNEAAFGQPAEANLVDALRAAGAGVLSLVAEEGGEVTGHIFFSPVQVARAGAPPVAALGLAPMAILPGRQRLGVGSLLIRTALDEVRRLGHGAVVVLGHPDYYPRFGFVRASRFGLRWEHPCDDAAFMAQELRPGALGEGPGVVRFRPEFDAV